MMRIGHGYDVHRLVAGRKLILGGVDIPFETGLLGHSDADVLLHAISDAILGAIGEGDIGRHFPDTDPAFKGASSLLLLGEVMALADRKGYRIGNVDATIVAQRPKLAPYIVRMKENIAAVLGCDASRVNVKATTTEELGFAGRQEGIAAYSVALLEEKQMSRCR
jgi:2-C-methyl-D-erythritol 2,4-cyclodiphosphate synthase